MSNKKILNHTELAQFLGVGTTTLYRMIEDGRFPVEPIAGTKLYSLDKVEEWIKN